MEGRHFDDFFSQDFSHFALLRLLCYVHFMIIILHRYHHDQISDRVTGNRTGVFFF